MTDIRARAADIVEQHLTLKFRRHESAVAIATGLDDYGLLVGGLGYADAVERTVNQLQCRMEWKTAELIAADLARAGLLTS